MEKVALSIENKKSLELEVILRQVPVTYMFTAYFEPCVFPLRLSILSAEWTAVYYTGLEKGKE